MGNSYTAEFWQYDPRLGRRWNIDPKSNPSISSYAAFENNPIFYIDPKGDTVRVTDAFAANKSKMRAYDLWRKSKSGEKFLKDYDIGGKYENVSVVFDVGSDYWGETIVYGVDGKGNKRRVIPMDVVENEKGEDGIFEPNRNYGLKSGESLRIVLSFGLSYDDNENDESSYGIVHNGLAIVHETQHLRHDHYDIMHNNYIRS